MKELFRIKFDHHDVYSDDSEGAHSVRAYRMYTLGAKGLIDDEMLTPKKMRLKDDKIIVDFEEWGIRHVFAYTDDCELFYRDKPKRNEETKTSS